MNTQAPHNIQQLRDSMTRMQLDAYIIPTADPHQTEYATPHWKCREWLSGFSGSAGTVVILSEKAGLWTDGRYFIQAEQELKDTGIVLFKDRLPGVPKLIDWVCENISENGTVGVDGRQLSSKQADEWEKTLNKKNIQLTTDLDLVSKLWKNRPAVPDAPTFLHSIEYAGQSVAKKLDAIRKAMQEKKADTYLLSSLYDIAWLFNLRGGDIPHCPTAMAYAIVEPKNACLFIDEVKITEAVRAEMNANGVSISPYTAVFQALEKLPDGRGVYLDDRRVNTRLCQSIPRHCKVIKGKDLTELPKARKNDTQLETWHTIQEFDGSAMVRFWKWIEEQLPEGGLTECTAADQLEVFRRSHPECVDLSFASISAYGPNAAMMHYFPRPETCATFEPRGLYLIDSGGQYQGGTTDITRTFALGELTEEERFDYTLVLKSVINLSSARFLKGTAGNNLDILARQPMWEHGLDYKCGTGHGVGHFLNVHEGPQSFSQNKLSDTPLEPGMVITIEPGVYKENQHGIRIENMVVVEADCETESGTFYRFNELTLCPIDTVPLQTELLSAKELAWLDTYHQTVFEKLSPHLTEEETVWLKGKTRPMGQRIGR